MKNYRQKTAFLIKTEGNIPIKTEGDIPIIYMKTSSISDSIVSIPSGSGLEILGVIRESGRFRILKARMGSKYVILKTPASPDAMSIDMLRREYELSVRLSHPCIVSVTGFETDTPAGPAIVMEYIDGVTLEEFCTGRQSKPSKDRLKAVLHDILDGVDYLHHRGIIHNDLKPDNIIVTGNGTARIIDFGLSASNDSIYSGCIGGTEGFTAPEILEGKGSAGTASDIYSIGKIMEFMSGGKSYRSIIRRCTSIDPSLRPADIRALREMIRRRDRLPAVFLTAAALLVLAGVLAIVLHRQRSGMESQMEDRIQSYSEQLADSLSRKKLGKIDSLMLQYGRHLRPLYEKTVDKMKQQKYREIAQAYSAVYYSVALPYADSVYQAFQPRPDGTVPDETMAMSSLFRQHMSVLDSLTASLPSIYTLPDAQKDSLLAEIDKIAKDSPLLSKAWILH